MAGDDKLKFCMDSLLNQTVSDYEIIAVDDKSTDNSAEILKQYEADNPGKVKVILSEKNGRQGSAKNKGIRAACGDWLGFIDSDDWIATVSFNSSGSEVTGRPVMNAASVSFGVINDTLG